MLLFDGLQTHGKFSLTWVTRKLLGSAALSAPQTTEDVGLIFVQEKTGQLHRKGEVVPF